MAAHYCVYGAGGHARDLVSLILSDCGPGTVACLVDDFRPEGKLFDIEVLDFDEAARRFGRCDWLVAVGAPLDRERIADKVVESGLTEGRFVSARAYIAADVALSPGAQVFPGCCVSTNARIGRGVILNFNSTISHDSCLDDFVTVSPGCSIAGRVMVQRSAFIGAGATVTNGTPAKPLRIGTLAMVGAGAVVTGDVADKDVVAGVPARSIQKNVPCL